MPFRSGNAPNITVYKFKKAFVNFDHVEGNKLPFNTFIPRKHLTKPRKRELNEENVCHEFTFPF